MIISASRRTDIPAFYGEWFLNRLKDGYVYVRNPFNYRQVSKVNLSPELVDCIVFWTKNPASMWAKLDQLDSLGYSYYFQFTLTPYDSTLEKALPNKEELITNFQQLAQRLGNQRVIWRYDPIILTDELTMDYHLESFDYFAKQLAAWTNSCTISFLDFYSKTERNMRGIKPGNITEAERLQMAAAFAGIAQTHKLKLKSCAETPDLARVGIEPAQCVDPSLIESITGKALAIGKDKNQRRECGCVESIDIGVYNTSSHGCVYCYANYSDKTVSNNCGRHSANSPLLIGELEAEDKVYVR